MIIKQVCVQPRQHDTACICCSAVAVECWQYLLPMGHSAANLLHAAPAVKRWDRQMDGQKDRQTKGHSTVSQTLLCIPALHKAVSIMLEYAHKQYTVLVQL